MGLGFFCGGSTRDASPEVRVRLLPDGTGSDDADNSVAKGAGKSADSGEKSRLQKAGQAVNQYFKDLPYKGYVAVERPGGRQRYLRNLSPLEWRQLYGSRYMYSSDYIHANPKSFSTGVAWAARLANRTEEWGELTFRFTGCYCRFLGGIARRSLRELAGAPRFAADVRRQLKRLEKSHFADINANTLAQEATLFLRKNGFLNFHGSIKRELKPADVLALLKQCGVPDVADEHDPRVEVMKKLLKNADRARKPQLNSTYNQWAMALGCAMSAGAFAGLYLGTSFLLGGLDGAFLIKMGALAAGLYFTSFLMRSAVTVAARATHAYRGCKGNMGAPGSRTYESLFEMAANRLRPLRNSIMQKPMEHLKDDPNYVFRGSAQLMDDEVVNEIRFAQKMGACMYRDPDANRAVRYIMRASGILNRFGDFVFSLDRIVAQIAIQRPLKDNIFRYHSYLQHKPVQSVHGKCNIELTYKQSDGSRNHRARQALASFIGHGGADALGMAVGCAFCSAMWTAFNIPMPMGMFSVNTIADLVAECGLGFASACAGIWGASATVATVGHVVDAADQRARGVKGKATEKAGEIKISLLKTLRDTGQTLSTVANTHLAKAA